MSGYIGTQPVPQATQTRDVFTATSDQTSFATSGYTPSFLDVWLNGVKLVNGDDFTATNGSDVVLTTGAAAGDTVEVLAFSTFTPSDAATAAQGALADSAVQPNDSPTFAGLTTTADIVFGDNDGATFGDGGDLRVWHGGWSSHVRSYNKSLILSTGSSPNDDVVIQGYDIIGEGFGVANYLLADSGTGEVTLYNSGLPKLVTKTDGIQVNGGVYLGGTGAANLLDDYEEGTWTPTWSVGGTITVNNATYVKVGTLCTLFFDLVFPASSDTNTAYTSIPFAFSLSSYASGTLLYTNNSSLKPMECQVSSPGLAFRTNQLSTISYANMAGYRVIGSVAYKTT